jgi:hypothetical protein
MNKHLLLPHVDDKRKDPKLMPRLTALVKRVTKLHKTGLKAGHCAEEFTLRRIHLLGHRVKLAFECPRLADPTHDPPAGKILYSFCYDLH